MKKINIQNAKIVTYLISIIGVSVFMFGMVSRNIEISIISLVIMPILIVMLWVIVIISWKGFYEEIGFSYVKLSNTNDEKNGATLHNRKMQEDSIKYDNDIIYNPRFSNVTGNILHHKQ